MPLGNIPADRNLALLETEQLTDPAAGSTLTYTPEAGKLISIVSISFNLTCQLGGLNRLVYITLTRDGKPIVIASSTFFHPQTVSAYYSFNRQGHRVGTSLNLFTTSPLPIKLYIDSDDTLEIAVINLQAGDQISDIIIVTDELTIKSV